MQKFDKHGNKVVYAVHRQSDDFIIDRGLTNIRISGKTAFETGVFNYLAIQLTKLVNQRLYSNGTVRFSLYVSKFKTQTGVSAIKLTLNMNKDYLKNTSKLVLDLDKSIIDTVYVSITPEKMVSYLNSEGCVNYTNPLETMEDYKTLAEVIFPKFFKI